jgi:hypothetical protein
VLEGRSGQVVDLDLARRRAATAAATTTAARAAAGRLAA